MAKTDKKITDIASGQFTLEGNKTFTGDTTFSGATTLSGGKVGIKTTDPVADLQVGDRSSDTAGFGFVVQSSEGTVFQVDNDGWIYSDTLPDGTGVDLQMSGPAFVRVSSLAAHKENIRSIDDAVLRVNALSPREYTRISTQIDEMGFIAEEIELVEPTLVSKHEGKLEGVKYPMITALLTKAIQELSADNDAKQLLIDDLTARIEALENNQGG